MVDDIEDDEVECPSCGNVQPDMGRGVACEECGEPMDDGEAEDDEEDA